jgi:uncharacterized protein (TIGR02270 family)
MPSDAMNEPAPSGFADARERAPLPATVGEPALLDIPRGRFRPQPLLLAMPGPEPVPPLEPPEPIPEPPSLTLVELQRALAEAEMEAEAPEPEAKEDPAPPREERAAPAQVELELTYFGEELTERRLLFDRARVCAEDLSMLGAMRRPLPDQGWEGRAVAERRLLARVDAIAACGDGVFSQLVALLEDRPLPDPEFTWALLFLFGSISGDDAADQAFRLARIAPLDADGMMESVSDALALAPHPALTPRLQEWLKDALPERRAAAVSALARRCALSSGQASAAARDADPRVAVAGATALRVSVGPIDPALFRELTRREDESLVRAALESAIIRRSPMAPWRATQLVEEGRPHFANAALILAIASGPQSLELLRKAAAAKSAAAAAIHALGWYGHPGSVEVLLASLEGDTAKPALEALQLITGATLTDANAAPEYEEGKGPFTATEGPVPEDTILTAKPEAWRAWWEKHGKAARPGTRYRFGHVWSLTDDLRQIEARLATRAQRWPAYLELCARSGANLPFDPDAFVARQRRQLADWSTQLAERRGAPGGWPVHLERS